MLTIAAVVVLLSAGHTDAPAQALLFAYPVAGVALLFARRCYQRRMRIDLLAEIGPVVGAVSVAAMGLIMASLTFDIGERANSLVPRAWLVGIVLVLASRMVLATVQRNGRLRDGVGRPALIVGAGVVGSHVAHRLVSQPEYGLHPIGFLDADPPGTADTRRAPVLGTPDELERVAKQTGAAVVILAFTSDSDSARIPLVRRCRYLGLEVMIVPRLFDIFNDRTSLEHLGGLPLLALREADPLGWEFAVKHALDRVLAVLALAVLAPLLVLIAASVKLTSPGPLLFRQRRVGRDGQLFELLKFRSMKTPATDESGFAPIQGSAPGGVEGTDRRTGVGRLLRRTSLDELPQLVNVVRGEMSLVGPRPERPEFVELFRDEISRYGERHRVRSGITGWAQVHGLRGQTSIFDRAEWDNYYIENWSLKLDAMVLVLTLRAMLVREDAENPCETGTANKPQSAQIEPPTVIGHRSGPMLPDGTKLTPPATAERLS